ncbi:carbohydrate sulfotransferase 5 [Tribolium castaneum]|uniref:Carbohydrate sulfotransferase 5-like Protein n=1 Tax=Tribolium castaneum TaxID=7070 RepID=D6X452_TRICA|nr:PREDICTED: carbohydrate sulfotransferase 5 [Tribolium castaneum]EEZ97506.1 Carbohydrate sulfotransferase 5-like Protein [Tribolium castaneum]|eukprot:XP_972411.1 PREDICTED: carbohydrate sulfotransferase 5 [Tribolium castaneum]
MFRRNEIAALAILASVCLLLVVFNQKEAPRYPPFDDDRPNVSHITLKDVVKMQQQNNELALRDYPFPTGKSLSDYTPVSGGSPLRTIIVTTWRSGSTFLGDVLNAVPGNYYHYEPLLDYGIVQIRGPPYADSALTNLKNLLNCDYSNMENYLEFGKEHTYLFIHNRRLWNLCEAFPQYCFNSRFLSQLCQVFPFQSMKTVRMRLRLVEELLKDPKLNVKVLLLVRDPRGTLQSRKHRNWCPGAPDCDKPNLVCADMVADYSAAIQLKKLYPDRFRAIRYEDLCADPYGHVHSLFDFFGLYFHPAVRDFLDSHTKQDAGGVSSTHRDTKNAPFRWRTELNFSEIQYIEDSCDQAMKLWGYVRVSDEVQMRELQPLITNYTIQ